MTPLPEILVVDDDRPLRSLLVTILKRQGFNVTAASNGFEALERLNAHRFDLMLLDLNMPRMNGYEVLAHLALVSRDEVPAIVVLSGDVAEDDDGDLVFQRIRKPFDVDVLIGAVRTSLAKRAAQIAAARFDSLSATSQPTVN
ncbi:MAG: response regulator [Thermoanaerobaculia bacterium]